MPDPPPGSFLRTVRAFATRDAWRLALVVLATAAVTLALAQAAASRWGPEGAAVVIVAAIAAAAAALLLRLPGPGREQS